MSSSAALAAAKKRRNVGFGEQPQGMQQNYIQPPQNIQQPRQPTNLLQLGQQHDSRIHRLEKLVSTGPKTDTNLATKEDFDKVMHAFTNQKTPSQDNTVVNKVEKQARDIISLTTTVNNLNRSVNEATTLITTLKVTVLSQAKELTELKKLREDFDNFIEDSKTVETNTETSTVIDVSEEDVKEEVKAELSKETKRGGKKKAGENIVSLDIKE